MILIDALYINNGGGKILLDYLMIELEKTGLPIFYLLDKRIEEEVVLIKNENIFLEANFRKRKIFYNKNKSTFSSVFCFGNLPPNVKMNVPVFTYFHQLLYLHLPNNLSLKEKILFWVKTKVLYSIRNNTDFWLVQSDEIKKNLQEKYQLEQDKVIILPFYPPLKQRSVQNISRDKNSYLFVSNGNSHKNHVKLIEAFCMFYDIHKKGKLILTIDNTFQAVYNSIINKQSQGYPITNIGFVKREQLAEVYLSCEYLVYPSLAESFGLGIVEAIESGCKIIGAKLPYTYAVCVPSIVFDPLDTKSMVNAFTLSLQSNIKPSKSLVKNNITDLINLLK